MLRISVEVKVMVVMLSIVGQGGWCRDGRLRPVLCHADAQPGGEDRPARLDRRSERGGGRSKSRSLTSGRLPAPG